MFVCCCVLCVGCCILFGVCWAVVCVCCLLNMCCFAFVVVLCCVLLFVVFFCRDLLVDCWFLFVVRWVVCVDSRLLSGAWCVLFDVFLFLAVVPFVALWCLFVVVCLVCVTCCCLLCVVC